MRRLVIVVAVAAGLLLTMPAAAHAVAPQGTYTDWYWPASAQGYYNFDHDLNVQYVTPDAPYFWSHQFGFIGGDGGYLGLQSRGIGFNGYVGKLAIFSIWQANGASGSCGTFAGEGEGYSCKIPYQWVSGRRYRLRLWAVSADALGTWWVAAVMDRSTGVETQIGLIRVPPSWGWLGSWSVMWTEYFGGPLSSCSAQPYSRAIFYAPTANAGTVSPSSRHNHLSQGTGCNNGRITDLGWGVMQEMGVP